MFQRPGHEPFNERPHGRFVVGWSYLDLVNVMVDPERGIIDPEGSTGERTRPEHDATQLGHPGDSPIDLPTDVIEAESPSAIEQ